MESAIKIADKKSITINDRLARLIPLASSLVILGAVVCVFNVLNIGINFTNSMPLGFYQSQPIRGRIKQGNIVAVCLPSPIAREGIKSGYLSLGPCHSGSIEVLKEVIATPGNAIKWKNGFFVTNTNRYYAPRARVDDNGQTVKLQKKYINEKNTQLYWLYGANDPQRSWDSRYYGGVALKNIVSIEKPVWTF